MRSRDGKLFTHYDGDARPADDNAPNPVEEYTCAGRGDASVLAWLRATGHLGS